MWQLTVRSAASVALVYCLFFTPALAQDYDGTLKGRITDESGIGVSGQTVTVSGAH